MTTSPSASWPLTSPDEPGATLRHGAPYVLRDGDDTEVTVPQGKAIVAQRYGVPKDVSWRRRTKKAGEVPHETADNNSGRGDPPRLPSFDPRSANVKIFVTPD